MINWIGLIERYIVDSRDVMELVNNLVKIVYKFSYSSASISKQRTNNHLIYTLHFERSVGDDLIYFSDLDETKQSKGISLCFRYCPVNFFYTIWFYIYKPIPNEVELYLKHMQQCH